MVKLEDVFDEMPRDVSRVSAGSISGGRLFQLDFFCPCICNYARAIWIS